MIVLHVARNRSALDREVEGQLTDMVLAHAVEVSDDDAVPVDLPAIEDGGRWVGATDLQQYVHDLQRDVAAWRKFQTDACYIDDDGGIC